MGLCVSCESAHGKGCTKCTVSACEDRDCSATLDGVARCGTDHYLTSCSK
jgi:hypothetical protein